MIILILIVISLLVDIDHVEPRRVSEGGREIVEMLVWALQAHLSFSLSMGMFNDLRTR